MDTGICTKVLAALIAGVGAMLLPLPTGADDAAGPLGRDLRLDVLCDDFEREDWAFDPAANSDIQRYWTGSYRGAPRRLERVVPPAGGLEGSRGALSLRTEGDTDAHPNQDDLINRDYTSRLGRTLVRADRPVFMARIWMPPFEEWTPGAANVGFRHEARSQQMVGPGNSVGYYYPSIWLRHMPAGDDATEAGPRWYLRIGTGVAPDEDAGPIPHAGWWTLALAFDEDGVGHYYARPGVGPLAPEHRIWDTTRFRPAEGMNPQMDSVAYGFFSLGYPADGRLTPPFILDDYEVWIVGQEPGGR